MNCCDYDCNQGRNCPARVAPVGRKHHDREALPPTLWRVYLRYLAKWMLILFVGLPLMAFVLGSISYV
jgi:hypothetical protein